MTVNLSGSIFSVTDIQGGIRLTDITAKESLLDRYGILKMTEPDGKSPSLKDGVLYDSHGTALTDIRIEKSDGEWHVLISLRDKEELYGLGDATRDRLDKRGFKCRVWVANVKRYAPIPFVMSSRGWAIAVNTSFEHYFDCGASEENLLKISSKFNAPDLTFFAGESYRDLLRAYTAFSGRPLMLPRYAMGLTYVCNTDANMFEVMEEALNFRREEMPCDIIGLEPGWMDTIYDYSTDKKWSSVRFPIAPWAGKATNFTGALDRVGFKTSLWLCCDYDLTLYEERLAKEQKTREQEDNGEASLAFEYDEHLKNGVTYIDRITKPDECWFEHLKKFVDLGAMAFKLDGANQVLDHPDRLWSGKLLDSEVHNIYPVILAKQMSRGFSEYTDKRSMIYTAGGYSGIQQYAATWAGDTGGGKKSMLSLLNHGMSGHSNTSCDMEVFSTEGIHFGFLQPWCQLNNWKYWRQPWFLTDEGKEAFIFYDRLRYSLVPYFYTLAHEAYKTGMPVMRALPLMYPDDRNSYERHNVYLLGSDLLVGAFLDNCDVTSDGDRGNLYLPIGNWIDFWSGEKYCGGCEIQYRPPKGRGGALFVREGAILPTTAVKKSIPDCGFSEYELLVFGDKAKGVLYNDDGISLSYTRGEYSLTRFEIDGDTVTVSTEGSYTGMPENTVYTAKTHDEKALKVKIV